MEVNALTSTYNTPAVEQISSRQDTLDQLDFLDMLLAQMQNQDPLSPMDSQEYASQLAQFSSVQELSAIKESLDQSIEMNLLMTQSINGNLAAALVGKTVRAQSDRVEINGSGADLRFNLPDAATTIEVTVRDADGNIVRTLSAPAHGEGDSAVYWDGSDNNGNSVPDGEYTFSVAATDADGNDVGATTYLQGVVSAINYQGGAVTLTVNGQTLNLGDVLAVMSGSDSSNGNSTVQG
ncbi:MAG: flagellar hook assembly protein FlgD [Calditrichaeota bacterium]|nr:flagellar hook assembly protein FlgD [Calditrichota bacterium]